MLLPNGAPAAGPPGPHFSARPPPQPCPPQERARALDCRVRAGSRPHTCLFPRVTCKRRVAGAQSAAWLRERQWNAAGVRRPVNSRAPAPRVLQKSRPPGAHLSSLSRRAPFPALPPAGWRWHRAKVIVKGKGARSKSGRRFTHTAHTPTYTFTHAHIHTCTRAVNTCALTCTCTSSCRRRAPFCF